MPRLSVWFVRCALLHLGLGFTLGALLLAHKGLNFAPWLWRVRATHLETLLLGWALQLALGVAFWVLPRHAVGQPRGDERWGWVSLALLNGGRVVRGLGAAAGLAPGAAGGAGGGGGGGAGICGAGVAAH